MTKRWQPQIRAKARQKAATTGGIVIDTRARLGYVAPIGTTDEDRIRHLPVALPPRYAARLFDAQEQGASDQQLQQIAADALKEVYFQDGGPPRRQPGGGPLHGHRAPGIRPVAAAL
ncbi:hypothetical protein S1361_00720 [Streptomyces cyanogenus]|uniref:Uncharacterized protein n=1 Tax=Streptomyces cyanogenus TaxID=80860 RepID=A0ABX7TI27_STRCY|nr:hypothetical protein S1361_00720 [Streptomyces cyanogenus]